MYTWLYNDATPNNDDIVINGNQLTVNSVTYLLGGTYTCVVSNEAGEGRDSSVLYVNPMITTHPMSLLRGVGIGVILDCLAVAFPSPSYNWSTPSTSTNLMTSSIMFTVLFSSFGNYTCTSSSNGVVAISHTAVLTVSPRGSVFISPSNILTTVNSTVEITCTAQGGPNNLFEWRRQGVVISNDSVLSIPMVTGSDGGVYQCIVSNAAGSDTATTTVTVSPYNATITEVVVINMVTYTCYADGGPGNTYEWLQLRDNSVVSSMQELILDSTDPSDGGDYQCTITNNAGDTTIMTTINVAAVIVDSPQTQNVTAGQSFMLTCNATGYPVPTIEWRQNGTSYTIRDPSVISIIPTDELRSNSSVITVTNATTSDTGLYQCVATNVVGADIENATIIVQDCPDQPINVQFLNVTSRGLFINWTEPHDNNAPVTGYNTTYQNPDCLVMAPNDQPQDVTVTSMEKQTMITDLHPGENYNFIVIAINDICPSVPSVPVSVRTMEEAPATAPMVATPVPTTTTINVTWNELACQDHHGVITHYEVRYNTSDFNEDRSLTLNTTMGDDTSLLIEDLEEFGNYTIEVRAHTAAGAGPYSSPMNVQTLPDVPTGNVTDLNATNIDPTTVELSWGPVMAREQNGIILSYNIYYRQYDSTSNVYMMIINVTEMEHNITGLNEFEVYIFTVTTNNQVGESDVNGTTMIMTDESIPSDPVQNVVVTNVTDDTIAVMISWDPPSDPNGFIRYYRVEFQLILDGGCGDDPSDSEVMNSFANFSGTSEPPTMVTLTGLVGNRQYRYSIFPATSVGEGPLENGTFLTREDTPLAPNNLTVNYPGMVRNSTTLVITWDRSSCDRGVLSGYELCYVPTSVGDCVSNGMRVNVTGPDTLWYTINDLSINTNYSVEVRGRTGAGLGNPVIAVNSTDEDAPNSVVDLQTEFTPFNGNTGSYVITWTPPSPDNGSYYQILYYSFSSAYTIGPLYNGSSSIMLGQGQGSYNVSNALYYTNYTITITTVNIKYNISNGPVQIMDQTSSSAPTAIRDLGAVASSSESIYISWNHPQYPNSQLTQYIIYHRANPPMIQMSPNILNDDFMVVEVSVDMLSLNLSGLDPFTNYAIHVSVRGEGVSNAPIETEIITRTNSTAPPAPITPPPTLSPPRAPTATTITVVLPPPHQIETGELNMYGVVVVSGDEINNTPRDIITGNNDQLPPPYPGRNGVYTAAVWNNIEDVPLTFVVGGGEITVGPDGTEYVNRRLSERTSYGVFHYARLQSETERVEDGPLIVDNDYLAMVRTASSDDDDNTAGIAVGVTIAVIVVIVIIIVGVVVLIWYYQYHSEKTAYQGEVTYTTESDVMMMNPVVAPTYNVTGQTSPQLEQRDGATVQEAESSDAQ
ncbi:cell adhesion molecule DSCAML1-like isoform X2 [Dysidea avara]